ncbi:MAG: formylglycine-generating enzyme family protein, partial [Elainellaceae cyanobacterium]
AVTQAQWQIVAAYPKIEVDLSPIPPATQRPHSSNMAAEDHPVAQISWDEAVEFCQRLSHRTGHHYRLPSEAEWEYACRARETTPFHFGDALTPELATYSSKGTTAVNSYPANAFGLYDMHGNVWEWCSDRWHENYKGAPNDGTSWNAGGESQLADNAIQRVVRGGSWLDPHMRCRAASRIGLATDTRSGDLGFRVVRDMP